VAAIIAILARRTPLVRHRRVGWHGADLRVLKFRTMWEPNQPWAPLFAIEDVSNTIPVAKNGEDDRITSRFAAWCRKHSIDELPQLYHVVRGEMSFVGPRPITRGELDEHYGSSAEAVLSLRPGLTGLWQLMGRSRLTYSKRKRLDLRLVRCASPGLYFRILFRSVPRVLLGHDAH
jgi:lipopolysaccharide/colanic/teichoic acid biosynthesis glycosyltransferase